MPTVLRGGSERSQGDEAWSEPFQEHETEAERGVEAGGARGELVRVGWTPGGGQRKRRTFRLGRRVSNAPSTIACIAPPLRWSA